MTEEQYSTLAKVYGNMYTVWLGGCPLVVLNGCRAVKDGLNKNADELSGRPVANFLKDLTAGKGIAAANGHTWKQQRRFGLMALRKLGRGKCGIEFRIQEAAQCMVESFRAQKDVTFDPLNILVRSVANVISALVFGHNFSSDDATFQHLLQCNMWITEDLGSTWAKMYDAFPWLMKHVPGPHRKTFLHMQYLLHYISKELQDHKEGNLLREPQDVVDYYLEQIEKSQGATDSTFDEINLIATVRDLFGAGTETTAITLQWSLLYMVAFPHIQEKLHQELDDVLDGSKLVCYADRKRLPYTNAVVHEIQRYANIAAVGIPRTCIKEVKISGYAFQRDTMVLANLDSVLFDPQYWKSPNQFNPNNFLDSDGQFLMNEAFIPFSAGSRVCLGEQLARMEIFIFFTTLMRSFSFHLPEGVLKANTEYVYKQTLKPHPYQICAMPR
ncbi:cytochrome P450 2J4-like [Gastrophryne carolinensis]